MATNLFQDYFKALQTHPVSEITEHTYRSELQRLLEGLAEVGVKILHEPRREGKFGSPDFKITGSNRITGYVENKKVDENLDKILRSDQIKKYIALTDNLLLTNYLEWIWLRQGKVYQRETLAYATDLENHRARPDSAKIAAVEKLLRGFLSTPPQPIGNAKVLASALALRAKLLHDFLLDELRRQSETDTEGRLFQLFETFREHVFHELTLNEFADAFAQNLVYGLFLAKLNADTRPVTLYNAKSFISTSFELIRELVSFLDELDREEYKETKWIVEETLAILNTLDLPELQKSMTFSGRQRDADNLPVKDPYVYFYEDFLAAYDKKLRKAKGVYYTPPPVVQFIVRAVDDLLQNSFGIAGGLADHHRVTVLDFATGTGTFLLEVFQQVLGKLPPGQGKAKAVVQNHLLKNIFGFEYLIAPYTIAHLKISQFLHDRGLSLESSERLQIYLTNTLEPIDPQTKIPLLPALSEESRSAQRIKDMPILVITGNPPYSGISKDKSPWIQHLIETYKYVDGKHFGERKHWLNDDYVKFIRFAQDKMDRCERGIVAIITNHSFLDNPTFRGMRQSLMNSFHQLYFLDLHGNAKKKEKAPGGAHDENVFDIEQGVAISILVKNPELPRRIAYAEYWGTRSAKYRNLWEDTLGSLPWQDLQPNSPFYFFVPVDETNREAYEQGWSVNEIFSLSNVGIVTARDKFCTDFQKEPLKQRLNEFRNLNITDEQIRKKYGLKNTTTFNLQKARQSVTNLSPEESEGYFQKIHYRPFDNRHIFYHNDVVERRIYALMQHLLPGTNVGLVCSKGVEIKMDYQHAFVTKQIIQHHTVSIKEVNYLFPLYRYTAPGVREENLAPAFRTWLDGRYGKAYPPETVLGYLYSVLYSPAYRRKYSEFLKYDFPRIPFPEEAEVFENLAKPGLELVQVHLQNAEPPGILRSRDRRKLGDFIGEGDDTVEFVRFEPYPPDRTNPFPEHFKTEELGIVRINKDKFFDLVPESAWNFQIGGYQVLQKFLKDRKGRRMNDLDEIKQYEEMVRIIHFSLQRMEELEAVTKEWI